MARALAVAWLLLLFAAGCAGPEPAQDPKGPRFDAQTYEVVAFIESPGPYRVGEKVEFGVEVHGEPRTPARLDVLRSPAGGLGPGEPCGIVRNVTVPSVSHFHADCTFVDEGLHNATVRVRVEQEGETLEWRSAPVQIQIEAAADAG